KSGAINTSHDFRQHICWNMLDSSAISKQVADVLVIPILPTTDAVRESKIACVEHENVTVSRQGYTAGATSRSLGDVATPFRIKMLQIWFGASCLQVHQAQ